MTDAQDGKGKTFKCPLSQEALEQLHMVTGKLHKKGDDVDEYQAHIDRKRCKGGRRDMRSIHARC